jgi:hypothetical protein
MGQLDLDEYMLSSTEFTATRGVSAEHLSKVWRIDMPTATRTLDVMSQRCVRAQGDHLNRNYSTNDRMLRYRRIDQIFCMDTFFATKKESRQSSRGHTCMQLFVTDKGFVYIVPMRTKGEVSKAIKLFAKEIGAPDAIICDAAREQISKEVRSFCTKMGTALRVLEDDTPWANRAELYIGLVKEAVRKDMKESDCPLAFWDYCTERRVRYTISQPTIFSNSMGAIPTFLSLDSRVTSPIYANSNGMIGFTIEKAAQTFLSLVKSWVAPPSVQRKGREMKWPSGV